MREKFAESEIPKHLREYFTQVGKESRVDGGNIHPT